MVNFSNIPTSSQWITFPVSAKDQVTINWEDGRNKYVNTYHVAKCYYGILKDLVPAPEFVVNEKLQVPNPVIYKGQGKLTVLGETKIFIAAEFFEDEYAKSPSDLTNFHLKDIARKAYGSENLRESPWVTMKLNGAFCYGQSYGVFSTRRRYIVYHPCVGPGISLPNIHQHRFTGTETSDAVMKGLEGSAKELPEKYKPMGSLLSQLGKLIHSTGQATLGNDLKVFLDDSSLNETDKKYPELESLGDETKLRDRFAKIQDLESNGPGRKASDIKRDYLLAPSGKPVPSEQPEKVPDTVREGADQELAAERLRQQVEILLVEITENYAKGEAEKKKEEEKKIKPNSSQHIRPLEKKGQDNSDEIREQVIGSKPGRNKSLVDDNTVEQLSKDTSVLAIFKKYPIDQNDPNAPITDNEGIPLAKSDGDSNKLGATESFVHQDIRSPGNSRIRNYRRAQANNS